MSIPPACTSLQLQWWDCIHTLKRTKPHASATAMAMPPAYTGTSKKPMHAHEHIDNDNSAHSGKVVAVPASLFAIVIPCASDDEDEAACFHDLGGNAARACGHNGDVDSTREGGVAAVHVPLLALSMPCACDSFDIIAFCEAILMTSKKKRPKEGSS